MTRETKIGLLVGLGFIIVFAVLLSHTGPVPPAGDEQPLAIAEHEEMRNTLADGLVEAIDISPRAPRGSHLGTGQGLFTAEAPASSTEAPFGALPSPSVLEPRSEGDYALLTGESAIPTETLPPTTQPAGIAEITKRVAPSLPQATPAVGGSKPTAKPESPETTPKAEPVKKAPAPKETAPAKEYIVQKGDSLYKIAKAHYGTSKTKAIEYILKKNKGRIKSKDFVVVGQKILIPQLPENLFEPAPNFSVAKINKPAKATLASGRVKDSSSTVSERRAPIPAKVIKTGKLRTYTIKPKDTFSSIAKRELGSETLWPEIQKANKGIDPTRLRPGMTIKLPNGRPLSKAVVSGRD